MTWSEFSRRGRKALGMPPGVLWRRLQDEVRQQTRRPWANLYPTTLTDRAVFGGSGAASLDAFWDLRARHGVFFLRPSDRDAWTAAFRLRYPGESVELVAAAEAIVRHEFDLLGSGPVVLGPRLPWHCDFKTGREWPVHYHRDIPYLELDRPSDVKVPWELSRAQHFTTLGQAYWLTGDDRFAREYVAEIDDWIATNPLGYGVNWACAMDVALRAVNWIWGFYLMADAAPCKDLAFRRRMLRALFMHGDFVARHLETSDINGNHFLSDAIGLVFLGIFFRDTAKGRGWLAQGRAIMIAEIHAQVWPDGVDHEGSVPYHRLVLELFLVAYLLLDRAGEPAPAECWTRLSAMLDFVAAYTKPNGQIPLVGDADDGRVHKLGRQPLNDHRYLLSTAAVRVQRPEFKAAAGEFWSESFWMLGPTGADDFAAMDATTASPESAAFADGGYYVLRNASSHVFVDCGEVGMRGRGGHGHNDALSFELFLGGANLVSDAGAYIYTASRDWRNRFRSTAFHNTIQIDGEEINRFVEPDALWQLHYDARPAGVNWQFTPAGSYWTGSHTGYDRLGQPCRPQRELWLHGTRPLLAARDRVDGTGSHRVTWRWHLDPGCTASLDGDDCRLTTGSGTFWMLTASALPAPLRLEEGWVSKSYGVKTPTQVIVLDTDGPLPVSISYVFADARLDRTARAEALNALESGAQ